MYAIFKDGGHQYKAEVGKKMYLELRDVEPGTPIELTEVLAISKDGEVKVGQPTVPGAKIIAEAPTKEKARNSSFVGSVAARPAAKRRAPSNGRQGRNQRNRRRLN